MYERWGLAIRLWIDAKITRHRKKKKAKHKYWNPPKRNRRTRGTKGRKSGSTEKPRGRPKKGEQEKKAQETRNKQTKSTENEVIKRRGRTPKASFKLQYDEHNKQPKKKSVKKK